MNRLFPKLIFYSVACHYFIAFGGNQISLASTTDQAKQPVKSQRKPDMQKPVNIIIHTSKGSNNSFILVPPPPPEQPSLLDWSNLPNLSTSLDIFNKEELKEKLIRVQKQIVHAQTQVEEKNAQLAEAKDKADRFSSLYTEGVVSHKELDAAKKNVGEEESSAQEAQGKLADLQVQERAILRRLTTKGKGDKGKQYTGKSKGVKHDKKQ